MSHGTAGNPESILVALSIVALIMLYWRTIVRILAALIATGIILMIAYTAITIYQKTRGVS